MDYDKVTSISNNLREQLCLKKDREAKISLRIEI